MINSDSSYSCDTFNIPNEQSLVLQTLKHKRKTHPKNQVRSFKSLAKRQNAIDGKICYL
jgi:hypothetical protein